jgi:hypothetical protein
MDPATRHPPNPVARPTRVNLRATTLAALAVVAALASGCSNSDDHTEIATPPPAAQPAATPTSTPSPTATRTAVEYATALKAAMPRIKKVYEVTEKTDSNKLIGRPNGYTSAAVLADQAAPSCVGALNGIDCGVVIEVWPDVQAVSGRVSYIQGILKNAPALGSEFDYPAGAALLRVNGKVAGPSVARSYESAWHKAAG